ncbi:ferredoxin reductase family protein [Paracoccus sp. (in: a-proteobacteria)]|uniref:ferredoxin reductase family protein n=1 Tax=Paracoccus sp. TaxID=267 RepID=UPI0026DEDFFD|nr:ferredoxin reductase family protein [Paracoccus sp. (in: a-proteobacteria)]MDO5646648.1 ferredoxin reductase family protein [Paracoccus sp. (in: a-proteobacteria)]
MTAPRSAADAAPPETHIRPPDRPALVWLVAIFWLTVALFLLALPFAVILMGSPPTSGAWTRDLAVGFGFAALSLAGLQFALTGRLKPLLHPFGADIVVVFHRFVSWGAVALMAAHFAVFYVFHQDDMGVLNPIQAPLYMTAGRVALLCFIALIVSSEFRKMLRLDYLWWRSLHVVLALTGFGAAIWHVLGAGHFTGTDGTRALWLAVTAAWLTLMIYTRIIRPWWQLRNPWTVVSNTDEGGDVRSLTLRPNGRPLRGWKPGQFAWLSIGNSPFSLREHPFTISTAPEKGPELTFSIKPLGDDSKRLSQTQPGATAYIDGPYGVFSVDRNAAAQGFVMIAGGVGITPIISNLHALQERRDPRPIFLIYANSEWDDVAFRDELRRLTLDLNLRVIHVLENAETAPSDEITIEGQVNPDLLFDTLPQETANWPHLLCGPGPMVDAVKAALQDMGVPKSEIDSEIFEMV